MDATSRQKIASLERRIRELEDKHESGGVKESLAKSAGDNEIRLRRLELAVQATKDGVWDWDILNKRIWQSAPLRRLYGFAETELEEEFDVGDESDPWLAGVHPEDRPLLIQALRNHLRDDTPYQLEFRYRTPQRSYRWIASIG